MEDDLYFFLLISLLVFKNYISHTLFALVIFIVLFYSFILKLLPPFLQALIILHFNLSPFSANYAFNSLD